MQKNQKVKEQTSNPRTVINHQFFWGKTTKIFLTITSFNY